jgi:hypothetical protein
MRSGIVLSLAIFLSSGSAWGQAPGGFGSVIGLILDRGGNGMPDAKIVLTNESLGTQRILISTDDGVFGALAVVPAEGYRLKVTRKDFASWESPLFTVSTGQKRNFEIILQAEEPADAVTKTESQGGERLVDDTNSGVGHVNTPQQVEETPLAGRRLEPLVPLAPFAVPADSAPGVIVFHGWPYSNPLLIDGIYATDNYPPNRPGLPYPVTADSVQDFYTASAGYFAEFGRSMGGFLDVGTPSGTIAYHGEAHEYFRNNSWQASDRYALGFDTRQRQNQAGASVGGPLDGHNLFFYLNFQALDRSGQGLNRITNPLIANPSGTQVLPSNCQATAAQCFVATRFLQPQMNVLEPLWEHGYWGLAKVDYRRNDLNKLTFDAGGMQYHAPSLAEIEDVAPNGGMLGDPLLREQTRYAKLGWTMTTTFQMTNDLKLGWFQDRVTEDASSIPGLYTGQLGISIAGTTVGAPLSATAILPSEHRFQILDNGSWIVGSHTLKVGVDLSQTGDYISSLSDAAGWYQYPSLTTFAQDFALTGLKSYTTFTQTFGTPSRSLRTRDLNVYAEDTYKFSERLTLTYGLRYEHPRLPQPTLTNTSYFQTASVTSPWLDLSPRVGFAYLLNNRTVIRAGFGFHYAPFPGQLLDALFLGNGIYQTNINVNPNQAGAPVFPHVFPSANNIPNGTQNIAYSTTKFTNPYVQETSVAIERSLSPGTTITLTLLHDRGYKLWTTQDFNQANPSSTQITTETYNIDNASGQTVGTYTTPTFWIGKNSANIAHLYQIENGGSSWFNGAALQLHQRVSRGLAVEASYTFSHALDTTGQNVPFGTGFSSTVNADYAGDKGTSAFDQRQRAVIQWLWDAPADKSGSAMSRHLLNGWQVSGLTTLASSQPATPLVDVIGQQFSGVTMNYTSSLNGSGGWARLPFLPINSLLTGPEYNVDARVARQFQITERVKATLLLEGFNIFNMQYNTGVNTIAFTAVPVLPPGLANGTQVGTLKPVPGVGAGNAAQGFPDGTNARRLQVAIRIRF